MVEKCRAGRHSLDYQALRTYVLRRIVLGMKTLLLILALAVGVSAQNINEGKALTKWTPVGFAADIRNHVSGSVIDPDVQVEGDGGTEMSFANVQRSDDTFKGWVRFILPSSAIVLEGKWREARFYVICDCRKNSVQALSGIAYGVDGSIRAEKTKINMGTEPGSLGREMFEFFCERGGPAVIAPTLKPK